MRLPLCTSILALSLAALPAFTQEPTAPQAQTQAPAQAQVPAPPAPMQFLPTPKAIALKDGDVWVFLGDSITHQCLYTQYVEDYVYTRYPRQKVRFHNSGVGGDRASDALVRFDMDVAAYKPNYVTILLGMNDGGYQPYNPAIFDTYQQGMMMVLERIASTGAAAIPMTPTMFDSRADLLRSKGNPNLLKDTYYNGVLSLFGSWLREQSSSRGLAFVDMWSPLNNLTQTQRRVDPKFTMISDAVHPGSAGQAIMAIAVVGDLFTPQPVSNITLTSVEGEWRSATTSGRPPENIQKTATGLIFEFTAEALPWAVPQEAAQGFQLTGAAQKFSSEPLKVSGLEGGRYTLKIDDQTVGTYSAGDLAGGIDLAGNEKTPQYQQAMQVATLNKQRNDQAVRPLRDLWGQLKNKRSALARLEATKAPDLEPQKVAFQEQMPVFEANVAQMNARVQQLEEQIYQANQPAKHRYELTKTE